MVDKKLKIGYKGAESITVPSDWISLPIKEISRTISGGTPLRSNNDYYENGTIPWIKTGELKNKYIYDAEEKITEKAINETSAKIIPKNTVVVAMYGATIGNMSITKNEFATNQACCSIIPNKEELDTEYLYYSLLFNKERLISLGAGAAQPNISQQIIREYYLLLPPILQQKKISTILASVDTAIEKTEAIIEQTEKVKKGLMQQLLTKGIGHTKFKKTEIGEIPEEWAIKQVGDIFDELKETSNDIEKFPLYSLTIEKGLTPKTDRYERSFLLKDKANNQYRVVYPKNILFNPMNLRFGAIGLSEEKYPVSVSAYYNVLSLKDKNCIADYYNYLFKSHLYMSKYESISTGSLIEKKRVHLSQFIKLKVPVPPKDEQKRILEFIKSVEEKVKAEQQKLYQFTRIKTGLMQVLLTGKVRVKVDEEEVRTS